MITKEIVKEFANTNCPYLAMLSVNEKYMIRTLRNVLDKNPDILFNFDEETEEKTSIMDKFARNKELLKEAKAVVEEKFADDPATLFIENYKDYQEVSYLSMRYFALNYKNVKRADTVDGTIDGAQLENQEQIEENTRKYMADPTVDVILEGQITVGEVRARYDAFVKEKTGYVLLELKGTNNVFTESGSSIKKDYLYDLAFQLYVYNLAKLPLKEVGYIYLNKDFQATSYPLEDEELNNYFKFQKTIPVKLPKQKEKELISLKDYFENKMYVKKDRPDIEALIEQVKIYSKANLKEKLCYSCRKCDFQAACFPEINNESILKLTAYSAGGGNFRKSKELIEEYDVEYIKDIPLDYMEEHYPLIIKDGKKSLARMQIEYAKGKIKAQNAMEIKNMQKIFKRDYSEYPLVFFDFETFMYPVPLVDHANPWEQICCQYSMHVVHVGYDLNKHDFDKGVGGKISHYEFIGNPRRDRFKNPEKDLLDTLKMQLEKENIDYKNKKLKLIVYNKSFETRQFKRMGEKYPEYREFCDLMFDCIVDLMDFFSKGDWYQKCFNGRFSLKVTQPNLIKDSKVKEFYKDIPYDLSRTLNYKLGYIRNGGVALDVFQTLLRCEAMHVSDEENKHDLFINSLLSYCKIDSWGTVILFDIIKNVLEKDEDGTLDFDIDTVFLQNGRVVV